MADQLADVIKMASASWWSQARTEQSPFEFQAAAVRAHLAAVLAAEEAALQAPDPASPRAARGGLGTVRRIRATLGIEP